MTLVASLSQALNSRMSQTMRRWSQLGDQALTLQREVGTEECSVAWESENLGSRPGFSWKSVTLGESLPLRTSVY